MITDYDDYPVHQTPEPVTQPASTDPSFYDRYWFNGFDKDATMYFGAALGLYPNRQVMDGAFTVVLGKDQSSLHASRRAPVERRETRVGPLRVEVVEPMRAIRVAAASNDTGVSCDLLFRARTVPYEEPRSVLRQDGRVLLDTTRFTQLGSWEGEIAVDGRRVEVRPSRVLGARDRSWGIRPVGERSPYPPPRSEPGVYWVWSVNHFADRCVHFGTFEDHDGRTLQASGAVLPAHESPEAIPRGADPGARETGGASIRIDWEKGTRRSRGAELQLGWPDGERHVLTMEPRVRAHMKGLGYQHASWGHGMWQGEEALFGERWNVDELDPLALDNVHVQQVCRVRMGGLEGVGTLEQVVIGSHRPSGFEGLMDGAK